MADETNKPKKIFRGNLGIGDIIYINFDYYICLYCDKAQTILLRKGDDLTVDDIIVIPSKNYYMKAGITTREELIEAYNVFVTFKGILNRRNVDNVERSIRRILTD